MANDKDRATKERTKKVKKPKNFIEELTFMVSIDGIKRKAIMRGITWKDYPENRYGVGAVSWESFNYIVGEDADYIIYTDHLLSNDHAIFVAIYKHLREKQNDRETKQTQRTRRANSSK